jgi:hypothetical protein
MENLIKMSFFEGLNKSFNDLLDNMKPFMFFSLLCSFLSVLFYFIFSLIGVNNLVVFVLFSIVFIFITSFFINTWFSCINYENKIKNILKKFSIKSIFRTTLFVVLNILIWGTILGVSFYLYNRVVAFNFWLELFSFLGLTAIVVCCFFFLLSSVVFICYLKKEKWFIFHKIFWGVFDNINRIMGWSFLIFVIFFMFNKDVQVITYLPGFVINMLSMWCFYLCLALYLSILNYQYEKLFKNND